MTAAHQPHFLRPYTVKPPLLGSAPHAPSAAAAAAASALAIAGGDTTPGSCAAGAVGNDTGPMHIAAALGVPVVEISCHPIFESKKHHNAPERFGPYGVLNEICRPIEINTDFEYNIMNVQTTTVLKSCLKLLGKEKNGY